MMITNGLAIPYLIAFFLGLETLLPCRYRLIPLPLRAVALLLLLLLVLALTMVAAQDLALPLSILDGCARRPPRAQEHRREPRWHRGRRWL